MTEFISAIATLLLVMDPLGNVPVFLACLRNVKESRRMRVVARENIFALLILLFFLFCGPTLLSVLHIGPESLHIAGGVLLFLISLGMIFPGHWHIGGNAERSEDAEPFIVPLATPLLAGPSTIATVMIFASRGPHQLWQTGAAMVVAWIATATILMFSPALSRALGQRGLAACERLMGMVLTVIAVQMLLDGLRIFFDGKP
ncbi:MAG: MarC family protein [Thermoguttaceae bacterium]